MCSRFVLVLTVGVSVNAIGVCGAMAAQPPTVDMVLIPGGEFEMGCHVPECNASELPLHCVHLDAFHMDVYEVTNQLYVDALNWAHQQGGLIHVSDGNPGVAGVVYQAGGTSYPYCSTTSAPTNWPWQGHYSRVNWSDGLFTVAPGKENHPMLLVSWYGAAAYANWRSGQEGRTPC